MGREAGTLYINPKKFGSLSKPCMKEMMQFLNCLSLNHNSDEKCPMCSAKGPAQCLYGCSEWKEEKALRKH